MIPLKSSSFLKRDGMTISPVGRSPNAKGRKVSPTVKSIRSFRRARKVKSILKINKLIRNAAAIVVITVNEDCVLKTQSRESIWHPLLGGSEMVVIRRGTVVSNPQYQTLHRVIVVHFVQIKSDELPSGLPTANDRRKNSLARNDIYDLSNFLAIEYSPDTIHQMIARFDTLK